MPSAAIDNLIKKINTIMVNFSQSDSAKQYNEHAQGVAKLEADLNSNNIKENSPYFIGRYNIFEDKALQAKIEEIKAAVSKLSIRTLREEAMFCGVLTFGGSLATTRAEVQQVQIENAISGHIREKLSLPKGAYVQIKASRDARFVQVSLPADSIKTYLTQSEKVARQNEEVKAQALFPNPMP